MNEILLSELRITNGQQGSCLYGIIQIKRRDNTLFVLLKCGPSDSVIFAINLVSGDVEWTKQGTDWGIDVWNGELFVLDNGGQVSVFDPTSDTLVRSYIQQVSEPIIRGMAVGAGLVLVIADSDDGSRGTLASFPEDQNEQDQSVKRAPVEESTFFSNIQVFCLGVEETDCFVYVGVFVSDAGLTGNLFRYTLDLELDPMVGMSPLNGQFIVDMSIGLDNIIYATTQDAAFYEYDATTLELKPQRRAYPLPVTANDLNFPNALVILASPQEESIPPEEPKPKFLVILLGLVVLVLTVGLVVLLGLGNLRRALTAQEPNKCFLLASQKGEGTEQQETKDTGNGPVDQALQQVVTHVETRQDFSTDTLRSLYTSLLSGLVVNEKDSNQEGDFQELDMDQMIQNAIALIDTNQDGVIDAWEMEHVQLPSEQSGTFLFDEVVACTVGTDTTDSTGTSPDNDICVTADNVVEFLNLFFGGTSVVSPELAEHIREESGPDTCYTRAEFEALFETLATTDNNNQNNNQTLVLSDASMSVSMNPSFVLSLLFGIGTGMMVFGLS